MATILIIDDDQRLTSLLRSMLSSLGHEVIVGASATDGLGMLRGVDDIEMLMIDMDLPDLDGATVAIRAHTIGIPVLYMSGHEENDLRKQMRIPPSGIFLQKPFTMDRLQQKLLESMSAPSPSKKDLTKAPVFQSPGNES